MKRILLALFLLGGGSVFAQSLASPYSNSIYKAQTFTATGQTGTVIQLNGLSSPSAVGSSYALGTITVTGTSLTTVTFGVMGSSDNGVTYYPLPITSPLAAPGSGAPATTVTATGNGIYQVPLGGLTHVQFVTSGTFTATAVSLTLSASPNAQYSKAQPSGSGSGITQLTGDVVAGPGAGSQAATLAVSGVTAGSYTNPNITVDVKGRLTAAASGGLSPTSIAGVLSSSVVNPPVSPANGDAYLLLAGGTGAWAGQTNNFAVWSSAKSSWVFSTPVFGQTVWLGDVQEPISLHTGGWEFSPIIPNPGTYSQAIGQPTGTTFSVIGQSATNNVGGFVGSDSAFSEFGYLNIPASTTPVTASAFTIGVNDLPVSGAGIGEVYTVDATSNNVTVTLPVGTGIVNGSTQKFTILRNDATPGANTVTVVPSAGGLINGAANTTLSNFQSVTLVQSAGTANRWVAISKTSSPSGVSAGSYTNANITVDTVGRVTAASNGSSGASPTSLVVITASGAYTAPVSSNLVALIKKTTPATTSVVLPASSSWSTCPATSTACPTYTIKDAAGNSASFAITITTSDGKNIDGFASYIINSNYQSVTLVLNGTTWSVI